MKEAQNTFLSRLVFAENSLIPCIPLLENDNIPHDCVQIWYLNELDIVVWRISPYPLSDHQKDDELWSGDSIETRFAIKQNFDFIN